MLHKYITEKNLKIKISRYSLFLSEIPLNGSVRPLFNLWRLYNYIFHTISTFCIWVKVYPNRTVPCCCSIYQIHKIFELNFIIEFGFDHCCFIIRKQKFNWNWHTERLFRLMWEEYRTNIWKKNDVIFIYGLIRSISISISIRIVYGYECFSIEPIFVFYAFGVLRWEWAVGGRCKW